MRGGCHWQSLAPPQASLVIGRGGCLEQSVGIEQKTEGFGAPQPSLHMQNILKLSWHCYSYSNSRVWLSKAEKVLRKDYEAWHRCTQLL